MKSAVFENVVNRQRYVCEDKTAVTMIDNVDYLTVSEPDSPRKHLMRRDVLKEVDAKAEKIK